MLFLKIHILAFEIPLYVLEARLTIFKHFKFFKLFLCIMLVLRFKLDYLFMPICSSLFGDYDTVFDVQLSKTQERAFPCNIILKLEGWV